MTQRRMLVVEDRDPNADLVRRLLAAQGWDVTAVQSKEDALRALDPPILVYDEPTSGLDPMTSRAVDDLIDETRLNFGVTSLVITHDIASCFRIAEQAVLLAEGRIVAQGKPEELAHGDNELAREFIANSGVDVDAITAQRHQSA